MCTNSLQKTIVKSHLNLMLILSTRTFTDVSNCILIKKGINCSCKHGHYHKPKPGKQVFCCKCEPLRAVDSFSCSMMCVTSGSTTITQASNCFHHVKRWPKHNFTTFSKKMHQKMQFYCLSEQCEVKSGTSIIIIQYICTATKMVLEINEPWEKYS
jgi:hypothetical protein